MHNLPLEVLIGANVLAPHLCSLHYFPNNKKRLTFGVQVCVTCSRYRNELEVGATTQMRFVDRTLRRRRNRLKIRYNFLATLPEAVCDESDDETNEQLDTINKVISSWVNLESLPAPSIPTISISNTSFQATPILVTSTPKVPAPQMKECKHSESSQTGKLQRVLADLKIATLAIPETLRKRLI